MSEGGFELGGVNASNGARYLEAVVDDADMAGFIVLVAVVATAVFVVTAATAGWMEVALSAGASCGTAAVDCIPFQGSGLRSGLDIES